MDDKYLYEVRPVKPIVIPGGRSIKRPSSLLLSKEEVVEVMKMARVYRKFPDNITPVAVTGENLDEMHKENFSDETVEAPVVEAEPEAVEKEEEPDTLILDGNVEDEPTVNESDTETEEAPVEEPVEEVVEPEPENVIKEESQEEEVEAPVEDPVEEIPVEEEVVEPEVEEELVEDEVVEVPTEDTVLIPDEEVIDPEASEETPVVEELEKGVNQDDATENITAGNTAVEEAVVENTVTEDETVEPTATEDVTETKSHGFHEKNNIQFNISK